MRNVTDYAIVTATYWVFTLTDGALRMLVLLHLHEQGMGPLALASRGMVARAETAARRGRRRAYRWLYHLRSRLRQRRRAGSFRRQLESVRDGAGRSHRRAAD